MEWCDICYVSVNPNEGGSQAHKGCSFRDTFNRFFLYTFIDYDIIFSIITPVGNKNNNIDNKMSHIDNHFDTEKSSSLPLNTAGRHALVWLNFNFLYLSVKWITILLYLYFRDTTIWRLSDVTYSGMNKTN